MIKLAPWILVLFFMTSCGKELLLDRRGSSQNELSQDQIVSEQPDSSETSPSDDPIVVEPPKEEIPPKPLTDSEIIELGLSTFDIDNLKSELEFITDEQHLGRLSGTDGNIAVADYLIDHLRDLDIEPAQSGEYRQTFTIRNGPTRGRKTSNIIGILPGQDENLKDEYVVIGAHMDHAGTLELGYTCSRGKSGSTKTCNGADDNGSGTIGLLNIAKALSEVRDHIKRTVVIMWFSGEEEGLEGSWHYVNNPIFPLDQTVYMINLDMIGYAHTNNNRVSALGGGTSSFGQKVLESLDDKYNKLAVDITSKAGGGSDHVPFMSKGIPGNFFNTGVNNNTNYHRTSDTHEKIFYEGMMTVAKMAFELGFMVTGESSVSVKKSFSGEPLPREPLVTKEEESQSCHHLIKNPYLDNLSKLMEYGILK